RHIGYRWRPDDLEALLANVQGLRPQPPKNQGPFKRSFYYDPKVLKNFHDIRRILRNAKVHVKIIASHSEFLDFLPVRASKGLAVRHLCLRWGMPLENVLVAGDSGNDKEMLSGDTCGVVVGNYSSELKTLRQSDSLYFAQGMYAQGVIEGMDHYGF
ncbi:MAG: HAD hydrolase family protein, partial [Proteobacteria bacterium]|nr:HAD hydrolase family protein [Pseudomonadota bacterium]